MDKDHHYSLTVTWTGNKGSGTSGYTDYARDHIVQAIGKQIIECSSDPAFRGDISRYNPEELLVSSIASCHMLWYLHLCARDGVIILAYEDRATGTMTETATGGGKFKEVILHPVVTLEDPRMEEKANLIHPRARELCFIANSVNFPVYHKPEIRILGS